MVLNKSLFLLILAILIISPIILAETISDTSVNKITITEDKIQEPATKSISFSPSCYFEKFNTMTATLFPGFLKILLILFVIELILKGFALWRAVHKDHIYWFIFLLILSTAGILPIIYLLITRKK